MQKGYEQIEKYEAKSQPRVAYTVAENESLTAVNDSVNKFKEEQIAKFILGQRPLTEWDAYVAEVKKLGVQKMLERLCWVCTGLCSASRRRSSSL